MDTTMKIAIICDVLGKENNGTTVAAMNLIRSLKAKGHDVRVVCPDEDRRGDEGFYIVKKINFGIFNEYVEENGVVISRPDEDTLRTVIHDADVCHLVTRSLWRIREWRSRVNTACRSRRPSTARRRISRATSSS